MTAKVDPEFEGIFDHLWENRTPVEEPKGEEPESDFFQELTKRMKTQVLKACEKCGKEFKGQPETPLCTSCYFLEKYPEFQPKRWTWTKIESQWGVTAIWPDKDPLPEPGETITVHRKDDTTSEVTLREYNETRGTPSGERKVFFHIKK